MKIEILYLRENTPFSQELMRWAEERELQVQTLAEKPEEVEDVDGLVIFTENQEVEKEISDLRVLFDNRQKPVHKIDINGTLMVGVSNLDLWIESNKCKKVLFIGTDNLLKNINLNRYLENIQ